MLLTLRKPHIMNLKHHREETGRPLCVPHFFAVLTGKGKGKKKVHEISSHQEAYIITQFSRIHCKQWCWQNKTESKMFQPQNKRHNPASHCSCKSSSLQVCNKLLLASWLIYKRLTHARSHCEQEMLDIICLVFWSLPWGPSSNTAV